MRHTFAANAAASAGILMGLLAVEHWMSTPPHPRAAGLVRRAVAISRGRNPELRNWSIVRDQTAGYYEKLLSGACQPAGKTLLARLWNRTAEKPIPAEPYRRGGFLYYEPKAQVQYFGPEDPKELVTNSFGLADQEYTRQKPPNTRRVALIGDSLSRGYGVSVGERFETRLENQLNQEVRRITGERFEVLNFGVDGYRITQLLDVAMEKVPILDPDVYLLTITEVTVAPNWGSHLAALVRDGIDLKYGFLRETVKASGLRREDEGDLVQARLAPYRLPVLRQVLRLLQMRTQQRDAYLIVVLLPAVEDAAMIQHRFAGIRDLVEGMGITVVDLLDTFDGVTDLETVRTAWHDLHPNAAGHQLVAENLYKKLHAQPEAWSALTGMGAAGRWEAHKHRDAAWQSDLTAGSGGQ